MEKEKERGWGDRRHVKVDVDSVSRDNPTTDLVSGVTNIQISYNGDLLLFQGYEAPTVGYTAGAWVSFEVLIQENTEESENPKEA